MDRGAAIDRRPASSLVAALGLTPPALVSLVGGGGKTTAMYRLLRELRAAGVTAVAATTTRIAPPGPGDGAALVCGASWDELRAALRQPRPGGIPPVLGARVLPSGKVGGLPPDWCRRILAEGLADVVVVEADGAARRPLKAPEAWEPEVPPETTLFVAVVGLSCGGRPLSSEWVFRPERAAAVAGAVLGQTLEPEVVARLLAWPGGLLKGRPAAARAVALLNQSDLPGALAFGRAVSEQLLGAPGPYESSTVGSLAESPGHLEVWTRRLVVEERSAARPTDGAANRGA